MEKVRVALVRTTDPYAGVRKLMSLLPHSPKITGATVLVKPNLCGPFPPEDAPTNTHPDVVGAVVRWLREEGAKKVLVGDEPVWGLRSRFAHEKSGMKKMVEREGGKLVYFDEEARVEKKVPGGRMFDKLSLPKVLDEVDLLVNVPKLKINLMMQVTLAIKNLFGLLAFRDRKKFHRGFDLAYALVDIAKVVQPQINIIDGIFAMEGMSAHEGTALHLELLIGSLVPLAADIVGSQVMGFNPMQIVSTQLALKDKMGLEKLDQIELVGDPLESFRRTFISPYPRMVHRAPNVEVFPGGICPGCAGRVPKIPPKVDPAKRYAVVLGRRPSLNRIKEFDEIWCFGDCGLDEAKRIVKRYPSLKAKIKKVPGCPPVSWWAEHTLKEELRERGWWKEGLMGKSTAR
jgi:uncharacterized protein (DUF362 family)